MNTSITMLTQEDFKGLYIDPNLSSFGYLLEVAKVAGEIFDNEISIKNKSVDAREFITKEDFQAPGKTHAAGEERSKRNEPVTVKEKPLKIKTDAVLGSEFERKDLKRSYDKFSKIPRPPQSKNLKTHQAKPLSPNPPSKSIKEKPSRMIQQPDLPNEYTDIITAKNGCELKLIIQKKLFKTDLEKGANRLSIPKGQLKAEFLGQKEQIILQEKVGGHCKGIEVPLIQPCLEVSAILLKNWKYGNDYSYMLSSQWNDVAEKNGLKADDIIQLWSFRVNRELWMALVKL